MCCWCSLFGFSLFFLHFPLEKQLLHRRCVITEQYRVANYYAVSYENAVTYQNPVADKYSVADEHAVAHENAVTDENSVADQNSVAYENPVTDEDPIADKHPVSQHYRPRTSGTAVAHQHAAAQGKPGGVVRRSIERDGRAVQQHSGVRDQPLAVNHLKLRNEVLTGEERVVGRRQLSPAERTARDGRARCGGYPIFRHHRGTHGK